MAMVESLLKQTENSQFNSIHGQNLNQNQNQNHFDSRVCINETLRDDELRAILSKLESDKDKEVFGLVCKRWLHLQSTERRKICARAGLYMLRRLASRFPRIHELDYSQSLSRSFYPGVTDEDLKVIANGFRSLRVLLLSHCKGVDKDTGTNRRNLLICILFSEDLTFECFGEIEV